MFLYMVFCEILHNVLGIKFKGKKKSKVTLVNIMIPIMYNKKKNERKKTKQNKIQSNEHRLGISFTSASYKFKPNFEYK